MAKLIYAAISSLDGYFEDEEGRFDWAAPDDEVHAFVNDLERPIGTYLYGRRMYETMVFWETAVGEADEPAEFSDYAEIWRAAEKVVYSRTLETTASARTRIEREFEPDAVRQLKQASGPDIAVGGATLAGKTLRLVTDLLTEAQREELTLLAARMARHGATLHFEAACDAPAPTPLTADDIHRTDSEASLSRPASDRP